MSITPEQQRIVNEEMFEALDSTNYDERISLCLKKGADINARNPWGQTLLMRAVIKDSPARVRFVLAHKPDLLLKDRQGRTVFEINKENRHYRNEITELLMKALPDGKAQPAGLRQEAAAQPEAPRGGDIPLAPPLNVKNRKKGGGGPAGGFRL